MSILISLELLRETIAMIGKLQELDGEARKPRVELIAKLEALLPRAAVLVFVVPVLYSRTDIAPRGHLMDENTGKTLCGRTVTPKWTRAPMPQVPLTETNLSCVNCWHAYQNIQRACRG